MYSFSSASQICDPLPRTINGASPPTERNARTGEFTPPGIMLSARCCSRRDCSVFREVVAGIQSSRHREDNLKAEKKTCHPEAPLLAPKDPGELRVSRSLPCESDSDRRVRLAHFLIELGRKQPFTIPAPTNPNSPDIHHSAIALQHPGGTVGSSSCPSNREGLRDSLGGSGLSSLFWLTQVRSPCGPQVFS